MMIDKAVDFIQEYLEAEYQAFIIAHVERDDDIAEEHLDELYERFYEAGMRAAVQRPYEPDDSFFWLKDEVSEKIQRRVLFQVKQYEHPKHGKLFAAYVSDVFPGADSYGLRLFFLPEGNRFKIVSGYDWNRRKTEWEHSSGFEIDEPGKIKAARKLRPPKSAADLAEYEL
jgi:hypothetical protein